MNNAMEPNFKEKFAEFRTYESREQCTRPMDCKCQTQTLRKNVVSKLRQSCISIYALILKNN